MTINYVELLLSRFDLSTLVCEDTGVSSLKDDITKLKKIEREVLINYISEEWTHILNYALATEVLGALWQTGSIPSIYEYCSGIRYLKANPKMTWREYESIRDTGMVSFDDFTCFLCWPSGQGNGCPIEEDVSLCKITTLEELIPWVQKDWEYGIHPSEWHISSERIRKFYKDIIPVFQQLGISCPECWNKSVDNMLNELCIDTHLSREEDATEAMPAPANQRKSCQR